MQLLHEIYGFGVNYGSYRGKLKQSLEDFFSFLFFLSFSFFKKYFISSTHQQKQCGVVLNTDCVTGTFVVDKESKMKPTTKALREATLNKSDELQDLNQPPASEELQKDSETPPKSICIFSETLIKYDNHIIIEKQARLIASITQDILFAVTRGKIIQHKVRRQFT